MRQSKLTLLAAGVVAVALLLRLVVFEVRDAEVAVVTTFGRPTTEYVEAGLHFKWPAPIQQVQAFDTRLDVLEGPIEQVRTSDGRAVLVGSFCLWRVSSARQFLERVRSREAAERLLTTLLRNAQSAAVSSARFAALVNADPEALRYEALETAMLERVQAALAEKGYGFEVSLVGIRKLGLPHDATEAVFERMREEREKQADTILAEGRAEAGRIRAEAEEQREQLLAEARAAERRALYEAEEAIGEHYRVLRQDPELAVFLKKLEALTQLFDERTTVVFDTDQAPFDLLRGPSGAEGAGDPAGPDAEAPAEAPADGPGEDPRGD